MPSRRASKVRGFLKGLPRVVAGAIQVGNESADNEEAVKVSRFHGLHGSRRDLEYRFWHLLVDGHAHYLYVYCDQSAASFPIMVELTPEEYVEYHALGWTFLQYMAEKVNYWSSTYSARRVSKELQAAAEAVIADATGRQPK